ncbi:MAG: tripartite tricarboxylate transporter permease, partial [Dethiobacter sp.]|nr:tripartite tricarboxylate transporter permease [Dethiobacter sp.]
GGSITAILISTPGTAAAAATVLDGYPLALQGKAGKSLKMALYASLVGETFGNLVLLFVVGLLASVALLFGPPEYFAVLLFSLTIIANLSGGSITKGIFAAAVGLFLSTVGLDPILGARRFTFGISGLEGGLGLVPVLIGLFAMAEILIQIESRFEKREKKEFKLVAGGDRVSWPEFKSCLPAMGIGSIIGTWIGILPGLGQPIACFLSYGFAKQRSKNPELFGKGSLEGVAAAESGNNAVNGPAMVPMLALGIPGDTVTAVLLGAFIAQGLRPGPLLFETQGPIVYAILLAMLLGNIIFFAMGYLLIPLFSKIAFISKAVLIPGILAMAIVGAFAVRNSTFDVLLMMIFGFLGYIMKKSDIPVAPLVIALILGSLMETSFAQSLLLSRGSLAIFFTRPIPLFFNLVTIIVIAKLVYGSIKKRSSVDKDIAG